jgi:hypothetical protein
MGKPSDGLHEKQKHGRRLGILAFGNGWVALGCINPNMLENNTL